MDTIQICIPSQFIPDLRKILDIGDVTVKQWIKSNGYVEKQIKVQNVSVNDWLDILTIAKEKNQSFYDYLSSFDKNQDNFLTFEEFSKSC